MLDPLLGIGSSAIAAKRQGVKELTGIELDVYYLYVAKEPLQVPVA